MLDLFPTTAARDYARRAVLDHDKAGEYREAVELALDLGLITETDLEGAYQTGVDVLARFRP